MQNLARLYSLVWLADIYFDFVDNPSESILMYVSSLGLEAPERILESHAIVSVKLDAQESATSKLEGVQGLKGVSGQYIRHYSYQIRDLQDINVKTMNERDIKIKFEEEGDVWYMKLLSSASAFLDEDTFDRQRLINRNHPELHILITDQVRIPSVSVTEVFEFSIVAPNAIREITLEIMEYVGEIRWSRVIQAMISRPPVIQDMVNSTFDGLHNGRLPLHDENVYYMQDASGEGIVSVFRVMRPRNPFVLPGERASREVAAYLLDHPRSGHRKDYPDRDGFAGVPPTAMIRYWRGGSRQWLVGSLQRYVADACKDKEVSYFPADEVHKISVLDIRLANSKRNRGNILVVEEEDKKIHLNPINHGFCFPSNFDRVEFVWRDWPQAQEPYSPEIVEYVEKLDAETDIEFLKSYGWEIGSETARMLKVCTMLLKEAVRRNLTAFHIANIMTQRETPSEKTVLQKMLLEAENATDNEDGYFQKFSNAMASHLDDSIDWLQFGED